MAPSQAAINRQFRQRTVILNTDGLFPNQPHKPQTCHRASAHAVFTAAFAHPATKHHPSVQIASNLRFSC